MGARISNYFLLHERNNPVKTNNITVPRYVHVFPTMMGIDAAIQYIQYSNNNYYAIGFGIADIMIQYQSILQTRIDD